MTQRTLPSNAIRATTTWDTWVLVGSAALLSVLAVADRVAAWMIGEFPTSAALWALRFEYLRPIGVFYELASFTLGRISGAEFTALLLAVSATLVAGALSRIRLVRALSWHALLASCVFLCAVSLKFVGVAEIIGARSSSYGLLSAALALPILGPCLRIHAEYLEWDSSKSRFAKVVRITAIKVRDHIADLVAGMMEGSVPATGRVELVLARRDVVGSRRSRR